MTASQKIRARHARPGEQCVIHTGATGKKVLVFVENFTLIAFIAHGARVRVLTPGAETAMTGIYHTTRNHEGFLLSHEADMMKSLQFFPVGTQVTIEQPVEAVRSFNHTWSGRI